MRKIPEKFKKCGIRIHCLKCRCEVTDTCQQKGTSMITCSNKEKLRFKLVVHVPGTQSKKRTRLVETQDFDQALASLSSFKNELKGHSAMDLKMLPSLINSQVTVTEITQVCSSEPLLHPAGNRTWVEVPVKIEPKYSFVKYSTKYVEFMNGIDVPTHLLRHYTSAHINETERCLQRFGHILKENGRDLDEVDLEDVRQNEIGLYCDYLTKELNIKSYEKACATMKGFYNWAIKIQDCEIRNPFIKMRLTISGKKDKVAITQTEFRNLLAAITPENGEATLWNGKQTNYYHPWLIIAFRVALQTGLRAEEVVTLNFNRIVELEDGLLAFKLLNLKVWRIQTGEDERQIEKYVKYVPITASLKKLLLECGYLLHKGTDKFVIPFPAEMALGYVQSTICRAFTHFIKQVTSRKIQYKDLRKTYITLLTIALGDKTKIFTGHADDEVIKKHYLSDAVIMGGLTELNIFEESA